MFGRKRQVETEREPLRELVADLAVAVRDCQARVDSMETRWKDAQDQLRRSYQRLEKAAQRVEAAQADGTPHPQPSVVDASPAAQSFASKWNRLKGAG